MLPRVSSQMGYRPYLWNVRIQGTRSLRLVRQVLEASRLAVHLLTTPQAPAYDASSRMATDKTDYGSGIWCAETVGVCKLLNQNQPRRTRPTRVASGCFCGVLVPTPGTIGISKNLCAGLACGRNTSPSGRSRLPTRLPSLARPHSAFVK